MAQQCTLPRCRHCQRLRTAAGIVPVDTSFDGWVVLRGLVEELASAADPCDALTVLAELSADEPPGCGQAGRTAIARAPGAVRPENQGLQASNYNQCKEVLQVGENQHVRGNAGEALDQTVTNPAPSA